MNTTLKTTIISTAVLFASNIHAVPNTFSAGQPARAAEVNANFADVESQISTNSSAIQQNATDIQNNTNAHQQNATDIQNNTTAIAAISTQTTFDFNNFSTASNITTKNFVVSGTFCGTHEERTIVRTAGNGGTNVVITLKRHTSGTVCRWIDNHYFVTATERQLLGRTLYDTSGILNSTAVVDTPIILETNAMIQGQTYVNGATTVDTPVVGTPFISAIINTGIALEIDPATISVPAGDYTGCLKITTTRRSGSVGNFQRISWKCPNVGEVKRIQSSIDNTAHRTYELESIVTSP